jgi:hypothetical protein
VVKITSGTGAGQYGTIDDVLNPTTLSMQSNWAVQPDSTSTFSVFLGNLGNSEVYFWPNPDNNSLPGNDFILSMGGTLVPPINTDVTPAGLTGTPCLQWRVLAHELGHTLGLRHGGTDQNAYKGSNYLSLMSYSWTLACSTEASVQSYSGASDPTFDDWANLQHNFIDSMIHMGNTEGLAYGNDPEYLQFTPEPSPADYVVVNGAADTTPPVVSITSPAAATGYGERDGQRASRFGDRVL